MQFPLFLLIRIKLKQVSNVSKVFFIACICIFVSDFQKLINV